MANHCIPERIFTVQQGLAIVDQILSASVFKSRLFNSTAFLTIVHRRAVELGIDIDRTRLSYSIHDFKSSMGYHRGDSIWVDEISEYSSRSGKLD
jgi:hypothetical protein